MDKENNFMIKLSVRELVEFVLSSGDLDNRRSSGAKNEAMQEGSRLHRKIQKRMGSAYRAEMPLKHTVETGRFSIQIEGRADGILEEADGVTVDEIKCIYADIQLLEEPVPVHLAQAMCYGYFYSLEHNLASIRLQLTYCRMETEEIRRFTKERTLEELKSWFEELIREYGKWAEYLYEHHLERDQSLQALEFPYAYREGQKSLAVDVYRAVSRRRNLYIQAPTGIGKTLSVLFPALKAMGQGLADKLFYLTAKTITRSVAEEALKVLRGEWLNFQAVTITAKEKLCILETPDCNPEACPRAKGHFDRVNDAVYAILKEQQAIGREQILEYANRFSVCPFELSLDVSNWVDGIICDYNYVFDPNVRLKRYFAEGSTGEYLFLVDEAHNLVPRAREMYSASLIKEDFLLVKKLVKHRSGKLAKLLDACNKSMLELKRECEDLVVLGEANHFAMQVMNLYPEFELFMEENPEFEDRDLVLEFFFQVRNFLSVFDQLDEGYQIYTQLMEDGSFQLRLFCINPSGPLRRCMDQGRSTILFSATLLPMMYYKELLSGEPEGYAVYAQSPFQQEKRLLLVGADVSSRYTRRTESEYRRIAVYICEIVAGRAGNYMVFCPSYQYMEEIRRQLEAERENRSTSEPDFRLITQQSHMDEQKREAFLKEFLPQDGETEEAVSENGSIARESLIALCVMGGIFGEGIDLKEESLIGAVIIGTGIPQVNAEQNLLRGYFEEHEKPGFAYAYQYPGMNKVMQAAGRVIRTDRDEGVIALLDDRFLKPDYQQLFPREWSDYHRVTAKTVAKEVQAFWNRRSGEH